MAAAFSEHEDHVSIRIDGKLGLGAWHALRDAVDAALATRLPLRLDLCDCLDVDYGGIGAVRTAQQRLSGIEVIGCSERFIERFKVFGICAQCVTRGVPVPSCPKWN